VYRVHGKNVSSAKEGRTIRYLKNYVSTNFSHREGLATLAKKLNLSNKSTEDYVSAYEWKAALQLKRLSPREPEVARFSTITLASHATKGFLHRPHMTALRRVRNIMAVGAMLVAPIFVVRRLW
jgi:hypothetical protein